MSIYFYTALDSANSFVKGKVEAKNERRAIEQLEREGFMIVNIQRERNSRWQRMNSLLNGVSRLDKIFFTRHVFTMLESGMDLDQAIKVTAEQTSNEKFREILLDIHRRVQKGESFHSSLSHHEKYFSHFFINFIKVGESSGKLDEVVGYLLEQQEKDYDLLVQARGAMLYPIVIMSALVGIVTLMMIFVIPKITSILTEYEVQLPLTTRILIGSSNFLLKYGIFLIPVVMVLVYLFRRWTRSVKGKRYWDSFLLKIPRLNTIIIQFNLARFARSMSSLLKSGVIIDQALQLSAEVSKNSYYRTSLTSGISFIQRGIPLAEVLKGNSRLYPPLAIRMIEVGEKTGKVDHMFTRLAIFYEREVSAAMTNLASVIEPALLLCIGFTVGFVAISVLTPIWKFSETI